jgi:hypothetical protein
LQKGKKVAYKLQNGLESLNFIVAALNNFNFPVPERIEASDMEAFFVAPGNYSFAREGL